MADLVQEGLRPLVEAVEEATKQRVHLSTAIRWTTRGSHGVKLECRSLGKFRMTSVQAVLRFVDQVSLARDGELSQPIETPAARTKRAKASAAKLQAKLAGKPKVRK